MNSNPAPVKPTPHLVEPIHGDYSYIMKSLAKSLCEKFGDIATNVSYNDPIAELIILMILLVLGVIVIVNYLY
jgi:hypothetical protein